MTSESSLISLLNASWAKRESLLKGNQTNAIRICVGAADGIPGLVIDAYDDVFIFQIREGECLLAESSLKALARVCIEAFGAQAVYRKDYFVDRSKGSNPEAHCLAEPYIGVVVPEKIPVRENDYQLLIKPYDGYSVGVFLDQRENRRWVKERAKGKSVLNGFCYAGPFSVAAAAGGAERVVSVDVSPKAVNWVRENFLLNSNDLRL